ncbi:hypothetical protein ACFQ3N_01330 [Virgibacillus byunsanensis]|uniref:Uncharacterized protein n=1 Tax=Virgibacillus byunsanensis TaxID=570945 RepID=A0ABW3LHW4_9BACI
MQLLYNDEQFNIDNNESAITTILKKINQSIEQKDTVFSHLIIDGVEVYENHEEYMKEHLTEINNIEIATRNTKEMIWETMESIQTYLVRAIPTLKKLVDDSYNKFSGQTWKGINQLAEGMQWIVKFKSFTKSAPQQPLNWTDIENSIQVCEESFAQLIEAVEVQDTVLISDILSYEVIPAYELLEKSLATSLKDEEFLKNVN